METINIPVKMQKSISDMLRQKGIPTNIKGFEVLKSAIEMCYNNPKYKLNVTKALYIDLAKEFSSTKFAIERCIRLAISKTSEHKTNSKFIFDCVEDLKFL